MGGGGGTYDSSALTYATYENCIIYFNSASGEASNCYVSATAWAAFTNCCFAPALTSAVAVSYSINNITADPQFIDKDAGNWRLRANSPCINTGINESWMTTGYGSIDLDGRTRIRYGTVDMGAYEGIYEGTVYKMY